MLSQETAGCADRHEPIARSITLRDGRVLSYAAFGSPGGVPVVYCHGMPGSHEEARLADAAARELDICLIAPQRAGYGRSTPSSHGRSIAEAARDILELIGRLELKATGFLGFSGGGVYAMACAAALGPQALRLSLWGCFAPLGDPALMRGMNDGLRQILDLARAGPERLEEAMAAITATPDALVTAMLAGFSGADRALFEAPALRDALRATSAAALQNGSAAMCRDFWRVVQPWGFDVGAVRCPATLWHGTADANVPAHMSEALVTQLPTARLELVPGAGHYFLWSSWRNVLAEFAV